MKNAIESPSPGSSRSAASERPSGPTLEVRRPEAGPVQFGLLQSPRRPWWTVAISFGGQVLVIALLVWLGAPVLMPRLAPAHSALLRVDLAPPPKVEHPSPRIHLPAPPRRLARVSPPPVLPPPPPKEEVHRPVATPVKPRIAPVLQPRPRVAPAPRPVVKQPPHPRPAPVKLGVFGSGSSARANINKPARDVQTGGFGAAEGVTSHAMGPANVPRMGSFGMPEGPGKGNGRAGARGVSGVVASAGFGNGIAVRHQGSPHGAVSGVSFGDGLASSAASRPQGVVRNSGFGEQSGPSARQKHAPANQITPLEVLYKPKPAYTPEARQLHIEGTVLLRAVFAASGQVRVLTVVRGLGHGLDQSAIAAARQIRFKPEQRNGHPVDTTATLAIVFQLAY